MLSSLPDAAGYATAATTEYPMRFIPKQRSQCAKCGRPIVERKRKPCPSCGSLNRVIARCADDAVGANDKL